MQKNYLIITFLMLSVFASAQTTSEKIKEVQQKYDKAIEAKDSAFLSKIFHPDMIITGGDGNRRGKKQEIADCVNPAYNVIYFKTLNTDINVFGNTAILRGDLEWQLKNGETPITLKRRVTFTYAHLNGEWIIVAQHIGMMPR
jgi:ketosteroid isomerase-like protein